jgi:hypothetical protein
MQGSLGGHGEEGDLWIERLVRPGLYISVGSGQPMALAPTNLSCQISS